MDIWSKRRAQSRQREQQEVSVAEEKQVMGGWGDGGIGEIVSKGNGDRAHRVCGPCRIWILPWVRWATILEVM